MNKVLYYRVCIYLPYSEYALNMPFGGEMKDESRTEIISTGLNVVICKEIWRMDCDETFLSLRSLFSKKLW